MLAFIVFTVICIAVVVIGLIIAYGGYEDVDGLMVLLGIVVMAFALVVFFSSVRDRDKVVTTYGTVTGIAVSDSSTPKFTVEGVDGSSSTYKCGEPVLTQCSQINIGQVVTVQTKYNSIGWRESQTIEGLGSPSTQSR